MRLSDISIGRKVAFTISGILGMLALACAYSIWSLNGLQGGLHQIKEDQIPRLVLPMKLQESLLTVRIREARHILTPDTAARDKIAGELDKEAKVINATLDDLGAELKGTAEAPRLEAIRAYWTGYYATTNKIIALDTAGKPTEAFGLYEGESRKIRFDLAKEVDALVDSGKAAVAAVTDATDKAATTGLWFMIALGVAAFTTGFAGLFMMQKTVADPVKRMTGAMRRLAEEDFTVVIPSTGQQDEIGEMAKAVEIFKTSGLARRKLETEQRREMEERLERSRRVEALIHEFEGGVAGIADVLAQASHEMTITAGTLSDIARNSNGEAQSASGTSQTTMRNITAVASATEELSASITEIGQQAQGSAGVAAKAVDESAQTTSIMRQLTEASSQIGEVVELISSIAAQTNLLALNATIEAARAGEAGKGFAVVANEVKALANQTAQATEQIAQKVSGMQKLAVDSTEAIERIGKTIHSINSIATVIAGAVQEQDAATREIARNIQQASDGSGMLDGNIKAVAATASEVETSAGNVGMTADKLTSHTAQLSVEIRRFLDGIRAA